MVVSVAMAVAMVVVASAVVVDYYDVYIISNVLYAKIESFDIEWVVKWCVKINKVTFWVANC